MNILLLSSLVGAKYAFERFIEKYEGKEITFIDTASKKESYTKYVDDARAVSYTHLTLPTILLV